MSDRTEGIAFSIEGLRRDADEIEACGGGNEAAHMRWAAARIADLEGWRTVALSNQAAAQSHCARVAELEAALSRCMIGGNHLAVWLPEPCPPVETEPLDALEQIGAGAKYDMWCCWRAIMQARAALGITSAE